MQVKHLFLALVKVILTLLNIGWSENTNLCWHYGNFLNGGIIERVCTYGYNTSNNGLGFRDNKFASYVYVSSYNHGYGDGHYRTAYFVIFKI